MRSFLCVAVLVSGCSLPPPSIEPDSLIKIVPVEDPMPVLRASWAPPPPPPPQKQESSVIPMLLMLMGGVGAGMLISQ
jgi:hypothetical protein